MDLLMDDGLPLENTKFDCCNRLQRRRFSFKCLMCTKGQTGKLTCWRCHSKTANIRAQGSAYNEDWLNYVIVCEECYQEVQEYWADRWAEYNSGRL